MRVNVGEWLGLGFHFVDVVAQRYEREFLVSLKWQQLAGTPEDPF